MSLQETIDRDYAVAIKNQDKPVTDVLRLVRAELTVLQKSAGRNDQPLTEEEVLKVVKSSVKKIQESISEYQKANRADLLEREQSDLAILQKYLPAQVSTEQIKAAIVKVRAGLDANLQNNFGAVMSATMKELAGNADGSAVSALVKEVLG